jgi:sulfofructose kinase
VGKVGSDRAAEAHSRELERAGVRAHLVRVKNCRSQNSVILVDQITGESTILWERDGRVALVPAGLKREWAATARALLVDGHDTEAAAAAACWAREFRALVIRDVDSIYPVLEKLLGATDHLIVSEDFPRRLSK